MVSHRPRTGWTEKTRPASASMRSRRSPAARRSRRDFRARDIPGWPKEQSHAFLIRVARADRIFEGVDLSTLGDDLLPDRLVLAEDLERDGIRMPHADFYGEWFLVPKGKTPHLLGEPVALLIYKDFDRFDAAKRRIQFDEGVVRYGAETGPNPPPNYGAARYVRIEGATPDAPDENSPIRDSIIFAGFKGDQPQWPQPSRTGDPMARGMAAATARSTRSSPKRATTRWSSAALTPPSRSTHRPWRPITATSGTTRRRRS